MQNNNERGFIALISAVIISSILMLVVITSGLTGFFSRFNMLDAELKERSAAAADACVDIALVGFARNYAYSGGMYTLNSIDECRVGKIRVVGNTFQFLVQATSSGRAVTDLLVAVNAGDLSVASWQEIANY